MDIPERDEIIARHDEVHDLFDGFLRKMGERLDGLVVADFGVMLYVVAGRLRGTLLPAETGVYFAQMLQAAESIIEELVEEGTPMILAEHWRDMEDGETIVDDLQTGFDSDTVPVEWLEEE